MIMRKFLLVAVIALVSLSASAVSRKQAPARKFAGEKKALLATPGAFRNFAVKQEAQNAFYSGLNHKTTKVGQISASRRAEEEAEPQLIPAYSRWTYFYDSEVLGGFAPQVMYDEASFLVEGDDAYFAPFANLGYVVGHKDETAENLYADYGAVVYTFESDVVAAYTNRETGEKVQLSLEPCTIDAETFIATRSGETTFSGYYFPEDNELYFTSDVCVALFDADNKDDIDVFEEFYVARRLYLEPQEALNQYISKGTYENKTYYENSSDDSGDCEIFLTEDAYFVKGADAADNAWVEYDVDEDSSDRLIVFDDQVIGKYNFYTDATRTATRPGIVVTVGLLQSEGALTAYTEDYTSIYSITDNADETTTIANTANTVYGDYVYFAETGSMYDAVDQTITILYEPAYEETAIKTVNADKAGKQSGVTFNMAGQRVSANQKGLVIRDGKKFINK